MPHSHNTLNSSQPAYLRFLNTIYHILPHALRSSNTPISCGFLGSIQLLLPALSALLPLQSGSHSLLLFALVLLHVQSVVFLKPTASIRPSVPPHKWLRFSLRPAYLVTYL